MQYQNRLLAGSVCWPVSALSSTTREVCHASSRVIRATGASHQVAGTTRWERRYDDAVAWLEWDWIEHRPGAVAQAEPLGVRSNVLLLDDRGRPLLSSRRRHALTALVYTLPWQGPVLDEIRRRTPSRNVVTDARYVAC